MLFYSVFPFRNSGLFPKHLNLFKQPKQTNAKALCPTLLLGKKSKIHDLLHLLGLVIKQRITYIATTIRTCLFVNKYNNYCFAVQIFFSPAY